MLRTYKEVLFDETDVLDLARKRFGEGNWTLRVLSARSTDKYLPALDFKADVYAPDEGVSEPLDPLQKELAETAARAGNAWGAYFYCARKEADGWHLVYRLIP